jgi:hypothetical protein
MSKKHYYLIVDTETTMDEKVADFGAVIIDRKGAIQAQCGILINGIYNDRENHPLFFNEYSGDLWSRKSLDRRYNNYSEMLGNGTRMLASVPAINAWLTKAALKYSPTLTAYNLSFDLGKCVNTGIDLSIFADRFCLWHASFNKWAFTKDYRNFALQMHAFNAPTKLQNMSFKTNAETMARYVLSDPTMPDEPHTALEDAIYYELPILSKLVQTTKRNVFLNPVAFDWRKVQVKDWFTAS